MTSFQACTPSITYKRQPLHWMLILSESSLLNNVFYDSVFLYSSSFNKMGYLPLSNNCSWPAYWILFLLKNRILKRFLKQEVYILKGRVITDVLITTQSLFWSLSYFDLFKSLMLYSDLKYFVFSIIIFNNFILNMFNFVINCLKIIWDRLFWMHYDILVDILKKILNRSFYP